MESRLTEVAAPAAAALIFAFALCICSCNSGAGVLAPSIQPPDVSLSILEDTFVDGLGEAKFTHSVVPSGDGYVVEVSAVDATDLRALFFELEYDAAHWQPAGAEATGLLDTAGNVLSISDTSSPGVVSHGQVVPNYDTQPGFSGTGVLARIELAPGAMRAPRKASAFGQPLSATPIVLADYYMQRLRVYYGIRGDLDMNGEVNAADILPVSLYYNQDSKQDTRVYGSNIEGNWNDTTNSSLKFYADGNSDGEVNQSDITTIVQHYGERLDGFKVCASADYAADYPFDGAQPAVSTVLGTFTLPAPSGNNRTERTWWEFSVPELEYEQYCWVHPVEGSTTGPASMVAIEDGDYPSPLDKDYGLAWDAVEGILSWNSNMRGDNDMNTDINAADINAIGQHLQSAWPFETDDQRWVVDVSRNGVIDFGDLAMIDQLFGRRGFFAVYSTTNEHQVPIQATSPETVEPQVDFPDVAQEWSFGGRRRYGAQLDLPS